MKQLILLLTFISLFLNVNAQQDLAQYLEQNNIKTKETPEGIHYNFTKKGKGETAKTGKFVKIKYKASLLDGTVFEQSMNEPFVFEVGYQQVVRGLDRGIQLFPEGAKGTLYIPAKLAFGATGKGTKVPANAPVMYTIEVLDVMDYDAYDRYMQELEEKEKADFLKNEAQQAAFDKQVINEYAKKNNLRLRTLPSGVAFMIKKKGRKNSILPRSYVEFDYEGYLPNGKYFDGEGRRTFKFWMGRGMVIDGIEQGMKHLTEGDEALILIPSKYGYGQRGIQEADTDIPENSVLIFDVKILKVMNK